MNLTRVMTDTNLRNILFHVESFFMKILIRYFKIYTTGGEGRNGGTRAIYQILLLCNVMFNAFYK